MSDFVRVGENKWVNEHDESRRPDDAWPADDQPPADDEPRADEVDEDTQPLWQSAHNEERPAASPPEYQPRHYAGPAYGQHHPYAYQTMPLPTPSGYYQGRGTLPGTKVPGWLWPVVAATALVVGLLGGTIGGVAVSTSMNDNSGGVLGVDQAAPAPLAPENGSVAAVAKQLLPSTVQIQVSGGVDQAEPGGATGSGFVLDGNGHVITNHHVVARASDDGDIEVLDHRGRAHDARIVGTSPVYDIAVLEIEGAGGLRPVSLGSSRSMQVGETVVVIGSPLGLTSTVTAGIVSALDRPVTTGDEDESSYINAVQTDAAINPGNSGGPLVNLRGQVIGVNSAIATVGGFMGDSGNIGVGFAIPMEQVRVTAGQILDTGEARYPIIGANVNPRSERNGAEVVEVPPGTPADKAGLEAGDIVVAVDDVVVTNGIGLIVAIRTHQPGETVTLRVRRDGREMTVRVTLEAKVG
jgi:putative serine protease PepD